MKLNHLALKSTEKIRKTFSDLCMGKKAQSVIQVVFSYIVIAIVVCMIGFAFNGLLTMFYSKELRNFVSPLLSKQDAVSVISIISVVFTTFFASSKLYFKICEIIDNKVAKSRKERGLL